MNERCFARKKDGTCGALFVNCPGYATCGFYKPIWRWKQKRAAHDRMLRRMPEKRQEEISVKYYHGNMPWKEDAQAKPMRQPNQGKSNHGKSYQGKPHQVAAHHGKSGKDRHTKRVGDEK